MTRANGVWVVAVTVGIAAANVATEAAPPGPPAPADPWQQATRRGAIFAECARNAGQILHGWIEHKRDPKTHLYSRGRVWNYHNEAADHYSSMVLMAHCVDPALNEKGGTLHQTLTHSIRLCTTESGLPASYNLATSTRGRVHVGALSEWLRDGLIRIVEATGTQNDWYRELTRLTDALLAEGKRRGGLPRLAAGPEARGNLLQTLARLAVMSGQQRYLDAAEELADVYLLGDPIAAVGKVNFVDHGCELVPGLAEVFAAEVACRRPRAQRYRQPLRRLLDRIVEVGRNPQTGLWCRSVDLRTGAVKAGPTPDTWGYVLFALENWDRATGQSRYRDAIAKPLRWLAANRSNYAKYRGGLWPVTHVIDNWSDSYEGMVVLWNRYRDVPDAFAWLDWTTHQGGHRRNAPNSRYGPGNGGHLDGSTGRTLCLHLMLCSCGVRAGPRCGTLRLGGVQHDGGLLLALAGDADWRGTLRFDGPRGEFAGAAIHWARINEMPRWFVVRPDREYLVRLDGQPAEALAGRRLIEGLPVELRAGQQRRIEVQPHKPAER